MTRLTESTLGAPIFVAAVSVAVTMFVWATAARTVEEQDRSRFENSVDIASDAIKDRLQVQMRLLRAARGLVLNTQELNRAQFKRFADSVDLPKNYPGMIGLGWSYKIPVGMEAQVVARRRAEGATSFALSTMGSARERHAILYLEPDNEFNRKALGFNMYGEPTRQEAMQRACDTGLPTASGRVNLLQNPSTAPRSGFLLYLPVYRTVNTPSTVEDRRRDLRGFVYSPFQAQDLFDNVFQGATTRNIRVQIFETKSPESKNLLFAQPDTNETSEHHLEQLMGVAGQRWTVVYDSTPFFNRNSAGGLLFWIPIGGLLVSSLLTALSWRQARFNHELQRQAAELERREFHQRLLAQAGTLLNESLEFGGTLQAVAQLAVPSFADWCAVDILEDGVQKRLAVAHINPEKIKWAKEIQDKYPTDENSKTGVPNVIKTGQPELYKTIPIELLMSAARDEEHKRLIMEIGFTSAMVVPIIARGRTLGAMTYVWAESKRHYDEDDLYLAQEIASRAGMAMDNSLLYQESEAGRKEVVRLNDELEEIVFERTSELELSNRELEAFAYSVSHDLRGPLRSVDGFSKSLIDDYGDCLDATGKDYISRIRAAARRMDELITALLNLSRITRSEITRSRVDVTALAEDAALNAKNLFGEHVEVIIQPGMNAQADEFMVHAVLDNLIGNAVKFSAKQDSPKVEVGFADKAFFVRDNGVGFNPQYQNKLFAPFERLHSTKDYAGSGIGLATVQRIVQRHGGKIWAESEEGKGATFYFTLSP